MTARRPGLDAAQRARHAVLVAAARRAMTDPTALLDVTRTPGSTGTGLDLAPVRVWTIPIPAPVRIVSANAESDWRRGPNHRAIRDTAYGRIATSGLPKGLTLIRVDLEIRFPRNAARRNETNYHPTVGKPCVDALGPERRYVISKGKRKGTTVLERGYGVIADDTSPPLHCPDCPHIRFGEVTGTDPRWPFGLFVLTVTDISDEVAKC